MEIRKFIIELHPDGKMTWCEYEDPPYYLSASANYKAGAQDAYNTIISILETRKKKAADMAVNYKFKGDREAWKHTLLDAACTDACIKCIESSYHIE